MSRDKLTRLDLRSESVTIEAAVAAFAASLLIADSAVLKAFEWACIFGGLGLVGMQVLRLCRRPAAHQCDVDLVGSGRSADVPTHDDEPDTVFGTLLAAVALPFVAAYVVVRIMLLYVISTGVVLTAAVAADEPGVLEVASAWFLSVLVAVANELVVIRPLAQR